MAETSLNGSISKTPVHSADGYEYGGSTIVTFGDMSINLGSSFPVGLDHLIAAAPALYAALESVLDDLVIGAHPHLHIDQIRAALSQARGEDQ